MVNENNSIPPELDKQIQDYKTFLFHPGHTWNSNNLEKEVFKYLDQWNHSGSFTDVLSTRFARIWGVYYNSRHFLDADRFWDLPLNYYTKWEENNNKLLHKGTPYYCRGMSAVEYGNIERGFLFFHQALEEDNRIGLLAEEGARSPAWTFVTFDYPNLHQAARPLLERRAAWLNGKISKYQETKRGSLSLAEFKKRALEQEDRVLGKNPLLETTFSFTFEVFRSENLLSSYPEKVRSGSFASQLMLDILFSLCRIGEIWLKEKLSSVKTVKTDKLTLKPLIRHFSHELEIKVTSTEFTTIQNTDFEECLTALLGDEKGPLPRCFKEIESDFLLIYILRNQAGHTATSSPVISERFSELIERVFFGLFKIIEKLY